MSKKCCGTNKMGKEASCDRNKKDLVVGDSKKSGKAAMFAVTAVAVAALIAYVYVSKGGSGLTSGVQEVEAASGVVKIPVAQVNDGKAHFYSYKSSSGKTLKFFVLKSSDGVIRAAFDACDVCFPEKKGYRQEGDYMVCNNCGQRFPSVSVNVITGGCNPSALNRTVSGDNVAINAADIESGVKYF